MATVSLDRPVARTAPSLARGVAVLQGLYFLSTGIWPLVSMDTFLLVTGPKTDLWLVETVGLLVASVGLALLVAAWRGLSPEAVTLAVATALALAGIDVLYVSRRVIPPVYMLDALAEVVLLAGWMMAAWQASRRGPAVEFPAPGLHR
jgi:hypothetical protein